MQQPMFTLVHFSWGGWGGGGACFKKKVSNNSLFFQICNLGIDSPWTHVSFFVKDYMKIEGLTISRPVT
jgi:hypothetical protein